MSTLRIKSISVSERYNNKVLTQLIEAYHSQGKRAEAKRIVYFGNNLDKWELWVEGKFSQSF